MVAEPVTMRELGHGFKARPTVYVGLFPFMWACKVRGMYLEIVPNKSDQLEVAKKQPEYSPALLRTFVSFSQSFEICSCIYLLVWVLSSGSQLTTRRETIKVS